jgi:hypothetical protein
MIFLWGGKACQSKICIVMQLLQNPSFCSSTIETCTGTLYLLPLEKALAPPSYSLWSLCAARTGIAHRKEGTRVPSLNTGSWCLFDEQNRGSAENVHN